MSDERTRQGASHAGARTDAYAAPREATDAATSPPPADAAPSAASDGPMTRQQASYLKALCKAAGEAFDSQLSSAEASLRIAQLQQQTGRAPNAILMDPQSDG